MLIKLGGLSMLPVRRKAKIKDTILEKKSVVVSELAAEFNVTEETIRRDLKTLEDEGILIRTYGGAFIQEGVQNEVNLTIRETAYINSKKRIADGALKLIHNGDSIFLDSSTTALFITKVIKNMRLTVITNSLKVINNLSDSPDIRLIAVGGVFDSSNMAFIGRGALLSLDQYFVDKSFISCRSLSIENGITDSNDNNADIRNKIIERSQKTYIIADYSKFNKTSFIKICDFEAIDGIISDMEIDNSWEQVLSSKNVDYYNV